jgi:hypothetical protein
MASSFRLSRGAAVLHFTLDQRQLGLRVTGLLMRADYAALIADVNRVAAGALVKSVVLDYSAAIVTVPAEILRAGRMLLAPEVRALPIAVLPPMGGVVVFRELAYEAAMAGLVRGIFPGAAALEQAQAWALRKEGVCPPAVPRSGIREAAR